MIKFPYEDNVKFFHANYKFKKAKRIWKMRKFLWLVISLGGDRVQEVIGL
jgi:hypothetical protein